jgi:hypothetical protein
MTKLRLESVSAFLQVAGASSPAAPGPGRYRRNGLSATRST